MKRYLLSSLIATLSLAYAQSVFSNTNMSQPYLAMPGEYVVTLKQPMASVAGLTQVATKLNASQARHLTRDLRSILVKASPDPMTLDDLRRNPAVASVTPNYIVHAWEGTNDPLYEKLWGMKNTGQADPKGSTGVAGVDINAEQAWTLTKGSKKITVAIIDTGVDYTHPDIAGNMWVNQKEKDGKPGVDDDGNGYVDDIYGYDFCNNDADPMDDHSHGTHVSGTIAGIGNNSAGVVGVNWESSIMAVKFLCGDGSGTLAGAVQAIDYATMMGARVMNNSWGGGGFNQALLDSITNANKQGALFVAAAGNNRADNDKYPNYPASYKVPNVVSVAAIDNKGQLASFSAYGKTTTHVSAPGVNVMSSVAGGGYESYSGTSMATPHVVGVAALVLSKFPNISAVQLKELLMKTSKPLDSLTEKTVSGGMVNAYNALMGWQATRVQYDGSWTQSVQTLSSPHPYKDKVRVVYKITVPGAKRVSLHFSKFETEPKHDMVYITDAYGRVYDYLSGTVAARYTIPVEADTVYVSFYTDAEGTGYGFDVDHVIAQ